MKPNNQEIILAFIARINAHDVEGLTALMSDEHIFVDARGNQISGKEKMMAGWRAYFEWFPDYYIEITDVFENDQQLALSGFAGGSYKGKAKRNLAIAGRVESSSEGQPGHTLARVCRHQNSF